MNNLLQDLRYGARMLLKKPGFSLVAIITLALGIGANTAIFTVVNAVLLQPLPFPESDRLVLLNESGTQMQMSVAWPNYLDWREQNRVFEHIGVFNRGSYNLTGSGEPERILAARMSADLFAALKADASIGRVYTDDEDKPGANAVVVLSHGLWQRRFGGEPQILNQTISLNGRGYTVIGVMPQEFQFPNRVEMWVPVAPLSDDPDWQQRGNHPGLIGVARLRAGVTLEQARSDMESVAVSLEQQYPQTNQGNRVRIRPLKEVAVGDVGPALWMLLGAVGFVLLIACANVANLLLARAATRQREMAIRTALGAGRWRIIRQLLTESVMLALLGGGLGVLLAQWGVDLLLKLNPDSLPRADEIATDNRVLLFTIALSILTGLVFGLIPALQTSRTDVHETLKEAGRSSTGSRHWLRNGLIVTEVALTLVLLVGAGLLIRSFYSLIQVDPGFSYERVLSFNISLPNQQYDTPEKRIAFYQRLIENIQAIPGVQSAGYASGLPLGNNGWQTSFTVDGQPPPPGQAPLMEACLVSPDYFRTMNISLKAGRWFTEQDNREHLRGRDLSRMSEEQIEEEALNSIVIDEEFARRHWPDEDAVGKHIRPGRDPSGPFIEVIGIVGRVKMDGLNTDSNRVQGYMPFLQLPGNDMTVVLKSSIEPEQVVAAARKQVQAIDPGQPIYNTRTLLEIRSESIAPERLNLLLLGSFASLALLLAIVGIYGVMSYSVTERTREIGLRMALGAQQGDVLRLVIWKGMKLAVAGVVIGLAASYFLTRLMKRLLFEMSASDPVTFALVALLLSVVALVACWVPARRAARVDPMEALRYE
ncbi:MAG: ABC transporter permease [Blastocatellia bacterium]|nr:ABC transporter permease [Blastocatellia bacterium]